MKAYSHQFILYRSTVYQQQTTPIYWTCPYWSRMPGFCTNHNYTYRCTSYLVPRASCWKVFNCEPCPIAISCLLNNGHHDKSISSASTLRSLESALWETVKWHFQKKILQFATGQWALIMTSCSMRVKFNAELVEKTIFVNFCWKSICQMSSTRTIELGDHSTLCSGTGPWITFLAICAFCNWFKHTSWSCESAPRFCGRSLWRKLCNSHTHKCGQSKRSHHMQVNKH